MLRSFSPTLVGIKYLAENSLPEGEESHVVVVEEVVVAVVRCEAEAEGKEYREEEDLVEANHILTIVEAVATI